jgi:hypothetical protein
MKKKLKKIFIISGIVFSSFAILLVISFLFIYFNKSLVKNYLEKSAAKRNGIQLKIGKLDYSLFPLSVQADSVTVFQEIGGMEVEVFLGDLDVKGQLGRLLRKKRPFLQTIDVTGATFRVHIKEIEEDVETDYQMYMQQVSDALSYLERLDLQNFSIQYITPTQSANLEKCSFMVADSENQGEFVYSLSSEKIEIDSEPNTLFLEASLQSSGKFSLLELLGFEGNILLKPSKFDFKRNPLQLSEIALSMKGEFQLDKKTLSVPQFEITVPSLMQISSNLSVNRGEEFSIESLAQIHIRDLSQAYTVFGPYLKPYFPSQIESLVVDGSAYVEGEYRSIRTPSEERIDLKGMMRIDPSQIQCVTSVFNFDSSVSGEFNVSGSPPDLRISGKLEIGKGNVLRDNLSIQDFTLGISLDGTSSSLNLSRFNGSLSSLSFSSEDKKVDLNNVRFDGQGHMDIIKKKVNLDRLEFQFPPLTPVQLNAVVDLEPQGEKSVHLKGSKLDSAEMMNLFSSFIPESVLELEPMGYFDFDIRARQSPMNPDGWDVSSALNLSGVGFHNPSFTFASEALHQKIVFEGKYSIKNQFLTFLADVDLSTGESLWNEYYVDWSQSPFRMKLAGIYHIPLRKLDDLFIETSLFSEGRINVKGSMSFQESSLLDLSISASKLNLGSLYTFLSQGQPIEEYALALGGDTEAQVRLQQENGRLSLEGRFGIKDGSIKNEDKKLLIDGMQVEIPFYYENPVQKNSGKDPELRKGYFSVNTFESPSLSIAPFQLDFHAGKNMFKLEPLILDVFDGKAALGESVFSIDPEIPSINGTLSFSLSGLDLSKLPVESEQFSLSGTVRADFPRVMLNPDEILTEGEAEVEMFDTSIFVENIKITKPFTKNRTISCDIKFDDLNLEMLTNSIPFGRVTGILKGEIKNLAFSYGQPESFILSMESVKEKGVSQKFSLGAVNDLSIISSGEGSQLSSNKGLTRFVSDFGYTKIGISCSLKNDIFTLNGTIREKGVEYLVKRSWLFGISVVNKKTRNKIRFKDMMDRLKRIGESEGATTKKKEL